MHAIRPARSAGGVYSRWPCTADLDDRVRVPLDEPVAPLLLDDVAVDARAHDEVALVAQLEVLEELGVLARLVGRRRVELVLEVARQLAARVTSKRAGKVLEDVVFYLRGEKSEV